MVIYDSFDDYWAYHFFRSKLLPIDSLLDLAKGTSTRSFGKSKNLCFPSTAHNQQRWLPCNGYSFWQEVHIVSWEFGIEIQETTDIVLFWIWQCRHMCHGQNIRLAWSCTLQTWKFPINVETSWATRRANLTNEHWELHVVFPHPKQYVFRLWWPCPTRFLNCWHLSLRDVSFHQFSRLSRLSSNTQRHFIQFYSCSMTLAGQSFFSILAGHSSLRVRVLWMISSA